MISYCESLGTILCRDQIQGTGVLLRNQIPGIWDLRNQIPDISDLRNQIPGIWVLRNQIQRTLIPRNQIQSILVLRDQIQSTWILHPKYHTLLTETHTDSRITKEMTTYRKGHPLRA